jgi:hypothetical protein
LARRTSAQKALHGGRFTLRVDLFWGFPFMRSVPFLAVAGAFVMSTTPAFAASFVSAQVDTNANTFLGDVVLGNPGISVTHSAPASSLPVGTLTALQSQSISTAGPPVSETGQDKVVSTDNAKASFASADVGAFHADSSWSANLPDRRSAGFAEMDNADKGVGILPAFDYVFDAVGADNFFSMDFLVAPAANVAGIQRGAWDMNLLEDGRSVAFRTLDDGGNGTFSSALQTGHRYELRLRDNAGLLLPAGAFRNIEASDSADFSFRISQAAGGGGGDGGGGVPEPSAWALVILGFGMTGAALRRAAASGRAAA